MFLFFVVLGVIKFVFVMVNVVLMVNGVSVMDKMMTMIKSSFNFIGKSEFVDLEVV